MRTWFTSRNGTSARSIIIALVTGRIALVAMALASPSVGMRVPPGRSPGRGWTGTTAGRLPPTLPIRKCGTPRLLPMRDQPTASTMHKRLLSVRLEGLRGRYWRVGCRSRSTICRLRCSLIPRLLVTSIRASPMARCGIRSIMARPGGACRFSWETFTGRCCCSCNGARTRDRHDQSTDRLGRGMHSAFRARSVPPPSCRSAAIPVASS